MNVFVDSFWITGMISSTPPKKLTWQWKVTIFWLKMHLPIVVCPFSWQFFGGAKLPTNAQAQRGPDGLQDLRTCGRTWESFASDPFEKMLGDATTDGEGYPVIGRSLKSWKTEGVCYAMLCICICNTYSIYIYVYICMYIYIYIYGRHW